MNNLKEIGTIGEKISIEYLIKNNYRIIEKNYNCNFGEIDIIAFDNKKKELCFIEVKTRTNKNYGSGVNSIDITKEKHIYKTAEYYLYCKKINNVNTRIDAIEIYLTENQINLRHYKKIILEKPYYRKRV